MGINQGFSGGAGTTRVALPDGRVMDVPNDLTNDEREELYYRLAEIYPSFAERFYDDKRSFLGGVGAFGASVLQGAAGTGVSAARGALGLISPGFDIPGEKMLERVAESDILNVDPEYAGRWNTMLGQGLGSTLPFLGAGLVTAAGRAGIGALSAAQKFTTAQKAANFLTSAPALLGAATGAGDQVARIAYRERIGDDVPWYAELGSMLGGAAIGTTEAIPIGKIVGTIPGIREVTERAALKGVKNIGDPLSSIPSLGEIGRVRGIKNALDIMAKVPVRRMIGEGGAEAVQHFGKILAAAATEGTQEAIAMTAQDVVARFGYDEDLSPGESWLSEFMVGGGVGAIMEGLVIAATRGPSRRKALGRAATNTEDRNQQRDATERARKNVEEVAEAHREVQESLGGTGQDNTRTIAAASERREAALQERWRNLHERVNGAEVEQAQLDLQASPDEYINIMTASFTVQPSMLGGYEVVDRVTGRVAAGLPMFETARDARDEIAKLNNEVVDLGHAGATHMRLRAQGLEMSPTAVAIAQVATHPDISLFLTPYVIERDNRDPLTDDKGKELSPEESFAIRHSDAGYALTAEEVLSTIGQTKYRVENKRKKVVSQGPADLAFQDRAVVGSQNIVRRWNKARAIAEAAGTGIPVSNAALMGVIKRAIRMVDSADVAADPTLEKLVGQGKLIEISGYDSKGRPVYSEIVGSRDLNAALKAELTRLRFDIGGWDFNRSNFYDSGKASKGFRSFLRLVAGTDRWDQMSQAQKLLTIVRMAEVPTPANRGKALETWLPFPDLSPLLYSNQEYIDVEQALARSLTDGGGTISIDDKTDKNGDRSIRVYNTKEDRVDPTTKEIIEVNDVTPEWLVDDASLDRFRQAMDHIAMKTGWRQNESVPNQYQFDPNLSPDLVGRRREAPSRPVAEQLEDVVEVFDGTPERREQYLSYLEEQFATVPDDKPTSITGDPQEKAEFVANVHESIKAGWSDFKDYLTRQTKLQKFVDLAEFEEGDVLVELARRAGQEIVDPSPAMYSGLMNKIILTASMVDPNGVMTPAELRSTTLSVLKHELMHHVLVNQYLTDSQMDALFTTVRKAKVPESVDADAAGREMSWFEYAKHKADSGNRSSSDTMIEREAIALMFQAWSDGQIKGIGGSFTAAMAPIKQVFGKSIDVIVDHDLRTAFGIFAKLERGDLAREGPGFGFTNLDKDIRAPRYLERTAPSDERTQQILEQLAVSSDTLVKTSEEAQQARMADVDAAVTQAERDWSEPGVEPVPEQRPARAHTPLERGDRLAALRDLARGPQVDPETTDQLDLFENVVYEITDSNGPRRLGRYVRGRLKMLTSMNISAGLQAELTDTKGGPKAAYHLQLSGKHSETMTRGIAKVLGEALGMRTMNVRAVLRDASVGDGMFGVVLDISGDVNPKALASKIYSRFGEKMVVDRIGEHLYILDESSNSDEYTEADALDFIKKLKGIHRNVTPYGVFLDINRLTDADYAGGLSDIETERERRPEDIERESRAGRDASAVHGSKGSSDLQRTAINRIYRPIARSYARKTGAAVRPTYFEPGSAIESPLSDTESAEIHQEKESVNAAYPPSLVPRYGDMTPLAERTVLDLFRTGLIEGTPIELQPEYATTMDYIPEPDLDHITPTTSYSGRPRVIFDRIKAIWDAPDTIDAVKSALKESRGVSRYEVFDDWMRIRELSEEAAATMSDPERWLAEYSAIGAAVLGYERVKQHMVAAMNSGLPTWMRSDPGGEAVPTEWDDGKRHDVVSEGGGLIARRDPIMAADGNSYQTLLDVFSLLMPEAGEYGDFDPAMDSRARGLALEKIADTYLSALAVNDAFSMIENYTRMIENGTATDEDVKDRDYLKNKYRATMFGVIKSFETRDDPVLQKVKDVIDVTTRKHPRVVQFGHAWKAWNDASMLEFMVKPGLINPNSRKYKEWQGIYFVPWTRLSDSEGDISSTFLAEKYRGKIKNKRKGATQKAMIERERRGSTKPMDIPLVDRLLGNQVKLMEDATLNVTKRRVVASLEAVNSILESGEGDRKADDVISYLEDGEKKYIRVADRMIVGPLSISADTLFNMKAFARLLRPPAVLMRELITRGPEFMIGQAVRDPISAWQTSGVYSEGEGSTGDVKSLGRIIREYARNLFGDKSQEVYKDALRYGVALEVQSFGDPSELSRVLTREWRIGMRGRAVDPKSSPAQQTKDAIVQMWDSLGTFSKRQEAATRMAVFQEVLNQTGNEFEATYQALEVINFGRRGANPYLSLLTSVVPFMNARLQGMDVFWRANVTGKRSAYENIGGKSSPTPADMRARAWSRGAVIMGLTLAHRLMWLMDDEDEYQNARSEVREGNWLIPNMFGGSPLKIPAPFETGVVFKAIPEIFFEAALSGDIKEAGGSLRRTAKNQLNFTIVPQAFGPLWDVIRNRNSFTGYDIEPYHFGDVSPELRYNANTNAAFVEASDMVGGALGLSPQRMEYLASNYFPGLGQYLFQVADYVTRKATGRGVGGTRADIFSAREAPILRRFSTRGGGYQQDFYDLNDDIKNLIGDINRVTDPSVADMDKLGELMSRKSPLYAAKDAVNELAQSMKEWRSIRDYVVNAEFMSESERRHRMRELEDMRDSMLRTVPRLKEIIRNATRRSDIRNRVTNERERGRGEAL